MRRSTAERRVDELFDGAVFALESVLDRRPDGTSTHDAVCAAVTLPRV